MNEEEFIFHLMLNSYNLFCDKHKINHVQNYFPQLLHLFDQPVELVIRSNRFYSKKPLCDQAVYSGNRVYEEKCQLVKSEDYIVSYSIGG